MRILAIDVGNTRIKWGWFDGRCWTVQSWIATAEADQLGTALARLPAPDRIVVSNVAGDVVRDRIAGALRFYAVQPLWIGSRASQCGVRSGYDDPAQLGCDRWAALLGAWHIFRGPCVIVNAGTTMTVDALSDEGVFLGGIIVPGIELMKNALARNTAQLEPEIGAFSYFPGKTADAIESGALNALAGAVDRMCAYMEESGQVTPLIVLSGGAAAQLKPRLNARVEMVDNLVLEGLLQIALND